MGISATMDHPRTAYTNGSYVVIGDGNWNAFTLILSSEKQAQHIADAINDALEKQK